MMAALSACHDDKADEKKQLGDILSIHDKVMGASEELTKEKIRIDSAVKLSSSTDVIKKLKSVSAKLGMADSAMDNWMHNFNPDYTGKSHTEIMEYLHNQRIKLITVDSMMTSAINESKKSGVPAK